MRYHTVTLCVHVSCRGHDPTPCLQREDNWIKARSITQYVSVCSEIFLWGLDVGESLDCLWVVVECLYRNILLRVRPFTPAAYRIISNKAYNNSSGYNNRQDDHCWKTLASVSTWFTSLNVVPPCASHFIAWTETLLRAWVLKWLALLLLQLFVLHEQSTSCCRTSNFKHIWEEQKGIHCWENVIYY